MPKVMIVDDDSNSTSLVKTFLELDGCEVQIVLRGADAPRRAQEFVPDVFLIDYHLGDREGTEIVQELRASSLFANTPIIMASGRDVGAEASSAGADMFLVKPYDPELLVKHIFALTKS